MSNPYDSIIADDARAKDQERRTRLRVAAQASPDQAAQASKLSAQTGQSLPVVSADPKSAAVDLSVKQNADTLSTVPKLSDWFHEENNAEVSHDDVHNLAPWERMERHMAPAPGSVGALVDSVGKNWQAGQDIAEQGQLLEKQRRAAVGGPALSDTETKRLPALDKSLQGANLQGFDPIGASLQSAPAMIDAMVEGGKKAFSTSEDLKAQGYDPLRTLAGTMMAGAEGFEGYNTRMLSGQAWQYIGALRDVNGKPIDPKIAAQAAQEAGTAAAAIETLSDAAGGGIAAESITGAAEKIGAKIGGKALVQQTVLQSLKRLGVKMTEGALTEGAEEGLQQRAQIDAGETAKGQAEAAGSGKFARRTEQDNLAEELVNAYYGAQAGGLMQGAFASPEFVADINNVKQASTRRDFFNAISDLAQKSKLRERLPEKFKDAVDKMTANGPVENVYVSPDQFIEHFQAHGFDPYSVADELPGVGAQALQDAESSGHDISIPMGTWAAKVVGTEHEETLREHARFSPGEMTPAEAKQQAANPDYWNKAAEKIHSEASDEGASRASAQHVYDDFLAELEGSGMQADAVNRKQAELMAALHTRLGQKMGIDPFESYQRYSPHVQGHMAGEVLSRSQVESDAGSEDLFQDGRTESQKIAHEIEWAQYHKSQSETIPGAETAAETLDRYRKLGVDTSLLGRPLRESIRAAGLDQGQELYQGERHRAAPEVSQVSRIRQDVLLSKGRMTERDYMLDLADGLKFGEIAADYNKSEGVIKVTIDKAKKRIIALRAEQKTPEEIGAVWGVTPDVIDAVMAERKRGKTAEVTPEVLRLSRPQADGSYLSAEQIARRLGTTAESVRQMHSRLRNEGFAVRYVSENTALQGKQRLNVDQIWALHDQGLSNSAIGRALGAHYTGIGKILAKGRPEHLTESKPKAGGFDLATEPAREAWAEQNVGSAPIPGEASTARQYDFKVGEHTIISSIAPEAGTGAATVDWTFLARMKAQADAFNKGVATSADALYGKGAEHLGPHELRDLYIRIMAVLEHDATEFKRDAYVFTPWGDNDEGAGAHRRSYAAILRRVAPKGYSVLEAQGDMYLVREGASLTEDGNVIESPDSQELKPDWETIDADEARQRQEDYYAAVERRRAGEPDAAGTDIGARSDGETPGGEESRMGGAQSGQASDKGHTLYQSAAYESRADNPFVPDNASPDERVSAAQEFAKALKAAAACAARNGFGVAATAGGLATASAVASEAPELAAAHMAGGISGAGVVGAVGANTAAVSLADQWRAKFTEPADLPVDQKLAADKAEQEHVMGMSFQDFAREQRGKAMAASDGATRPEVLAMAAHASGVEPAWIKFTLGKESGGDPTIDSPTSSASGLGQFTDSTWRKTLEAHGADYGLDPSMPQAEQDKLVYDPRWASVMTAEYAKDNARTFEAVFHKEPSWGEVYAMHFGGSTQGIDLIRGARQGAPDARQFFTSAAVAANHRIFFEGDRPRSAQDALHELTKGYPDKKFTIPEF